VSAIHRSSEIGHPSRGAIWLTVNEETRQSADLDRLLWPVPDIIVQLSNLFALKPGDLIYTGTPAGVGPIVPGDRLRGGVAGVDEISIAIAG
jgi:fumarylpyruvate hydrolase